MNLNLIKSGLFILGLSLSTQVNAMDICPRDSNGAIDLGQLNSNGADFNCKYTPSVMKGVLHKILLCKSIVDNTNYMDSCEPIFENSSGKDILISPNETGELTDGPISLPEGTYTHAVLLVENYFDSKFTETYSAPLHGDDGIGTTCWSNGKPAAVSYSDANGNADYTQFSATCGNAADADPQYSRYTYKGLSMGGGFTNFAPGLTAYGPPNKNVYLLSDYTTLAELTPDENDAAFEPGLTSDARYLLGVTQLSSPATIDANTSNVDLGFLITNAYFQKITTDDYYGVRRCSETHGIIGESTLTGAHACLSTSYNLGITFKFEVE